MTAEINLRDIMLYRICVRNDFSIFLEQGIRRSNIGSHYSIYIFFIFSINIIILACITRQFASYNTILHESFN